MTDNEQMYIKFKVDNVPFDCHRSVLRKFPNSLLAESMNKLTGGAGKPNTEDYQIVIHREATHFGDVLDFMYNPASLDLSQWEKEEVEALSEEANYYRIAPLVQLCNKRMVGFQKYDPKFGRFNLDSVVVFASPQELERHLKGRKKPAYLICSRIFLDGTLRYHLLELTKYLDRNLLEVYGFLGKFPNTDDTTASILYDSPRSRVAFSIPDSSTNLNVHYPVVLFIQKMLNSGSSVTEITFKWPDFWSSLTKSTATAKQAA